MVEITSPKIRLIGEDGEQVGIVPIQQALGMVEEAGVDLVEIAPTAKPPVCRLMDFGKFKYYEAKKAHEAKLKQKQIQVKEIKFGPGTDEGDYQIKLRNLIKFLQEGDKTKITLRFRGREMAHQEFGLRLLERDKIEILTDGEISADISSLKKIIPLKINFILCEPVEFFYKYVELTSTSEHLEKINFSGLEGTEFFDDEEIYTALNLQYIEPELREGLNEVDLALNHDIPKLIELKDLKGILHNHTTYSDGVHTLSEMAGYCKVLGYQYLGMCDHSKSALYANGLQIDKVLEQQKEIDKLNLTFSGFTVLKGIESDILNEGGQ